MKNIEIKISNKLVNYESAVNFMKSRSKEIQNCTVNELIWFLEHDHIYTQGTSASNDEILNKNSILTIKTSRGGKNKIKIKNDILILSELIFFSENIIFLFNITLGFTSLYISIKNALIKI
tara:strand:- start:85 stop:447 length:363 start_codon:yes stop_codon:yes gene_type:complete